MDNVKVMHICQAIRNINQLNGTSVRLLQDPVTTYELSAVYTAISLDELVDVSVFHPFRNHCESVFAYRHAKQR